MNPVYPPLGPADAGRYDSLGKDEREYLLFCLEFCSMVLESRPGHIEAMEMAANHYTALGYYAEGLALDRRLVTLKPDDPGITYNLACSLALTGRIDEAFLELANAIDKGYRDYRHMSTDRDLQPLQGDPRFAELLTLTASLTKAES